MPTYVYACYSCHKEFEVEQRITEDALIDCILCANGKVKRVIQRVAVSFKGAGFHINDYASKPATEEGSVPSPAPEAPAASPAPADSGASPAAKAE